jgi:hypothetical protein
MRFSRVILYGAAFASLAVPARADTFCAKHNRLAEILDTRFGEQQIGMGLAGKEAMVELYASAKGTFTLVSTDAQGVSCIVGAGDSWEKMDPKPQLSSN